MKRALVSILRAAAMCLSLAGCSGITTGGEFTRPVTLGGNVMENKYGKEYFANVRVGLFTHYTYATYAEDKGTDWGGTWYSRDDSRGAASAEEAAALFDGEAYAP